MWSFLCISSPAQKRYVARTMMWAAFFCCVLGGGGDGNPARPCERDSIVFLAVMPALPVAWTLVITGAYLSEEKDEFQRNLYIQALLCGMAATLAVVTAWGYMEDFGGLRICAWRGCTPCSGSSSWPHFPW